MHVLDNVIWKALGTRQASLSESHNSARRFLPGVSLLGGFPAPTPDHYASLARLLQPGERIGLFLEESPAVISGWTVVLSAPLVEMVYDDGQPRAKESKISPAIVALGSEDVPAMMSLTELTKPGPFGPRTREMGEYSGIRDDAGNLIAMAGERLKVPGYTEISAVCTHPQHLGKGCATVLINLLTDRIASRGEIPFLHVRADNARAVKLYESLGFRHRMTLQYAVLQKD